MGYSPGLNVVAYTLMQNLAVIISVEIEKNAKEHPHSLL
jgi:hypothetical protein